MYPTNYRGACVSVTTLDTSTKSSAGPRRFHSAWTPIFVGPHQLPSGKKLKIEHLFADTDTDTGRFHTWHRPGSTCYLLYSEYGPFSIPQRRTIGSRGAASVCYQATRRALSRRVSDLGILAVARRSRGLNPRSGKGRPRRYVDALNASIHTSKNLSAHSCTRGVR